MRKVFRVNATYNIVKYDKLPSIGYISTDIKRKINSFCKFCCKSLNIKVVLTPFKVADTFNMKDPILKSPRSFVCPSCNSCYIGQLTMCQQGLRGI